MGSIHGKFRSHSTPIPSVLRLGLDSSTRCSPSVVAWLREISFGEVIVVGTSAALVVGAGVRGAPDLWELYCLANLSLQTHRASCITLALDRVFKRRLGSSSFPNFEVDGSWIAHNWARILELLPWRSLSSIEARRSKVTTELYARFPSANSTKLEKLEWRIFSTMIPAVSIIWPK